MTAISIEGLGKHYRIGSSQRPSHFTLRDTLAAVPRKSVARLRGMQSRSEEFWALRDVSFEIEQGDVVGLIGRNGAGKSTLLKILSRIVEPTTGRAVLSGHVSSLLEVGTGFHFELTGRENVFLNGAILGMRRREILAKFDEIVEFAEVEQFLDTPVKFYSSGMYVRLAFAIAAHLEPDILIVDEVLAVGDQAFQKKSIGKMSSVARAGRTVVFVSHNMGSVLDLCTHGALLEQGQLLRTGSIEEVVSAYVERSLDRGDGKFRRVPFDPSDHVISGASLRRADGQETDVFDYGSPLVVRLETEPTSTSQFGLELKIKNSLRQPVAYASSWVGGEGYYRPGSAIEVVIPSLPFAEDTYYLDFVCRMPKGKHVDNWWDGVSFRVVNARPGVSPVTIQASDLLGSVVLENATFTVC
ncbi:MAG TPA: polysaccharide ABC transporter ATP-binding protein [Gaiellaceae bacterium]|jgi:lipopolysaccharide transport system ATP-binding protein|nr:polysaccharide ABC transporter ATP-binding protein [Gaiellaceae bacterium]